MSSLKFGTSGLRGLVTDLAGQPARRWTAAFLAVAGQAERGGVKTVLIGRDLRSSSPTIAQDCAAAAAALGWEAADCGALPTPALALAAMERGVPAVMVTGSHIPDDRNGLKFYLASGEITKEDEAAIRAALDAQPADIPDAPPAATEGRALDAYVARYLDFFPGDLLAGLHVGVYQQSAVARDCLVEILQGLGARVTPLGRSTHFVPIDTEAHHPRDLALFARWAEPGAFDAIVSTDGDADRPLVTDAAGMVVRGDLLGLLAAAHLKLRSIATPVTSSAAVERSGVATTIRRTRVGSPYVIEGMAAILDAGEGDVIGFEPNGGVLLGSQVSRGGRHLAALPTRDAVLPILTALASAKAAAGGLRAAAERLGAGHALADRLPDVPAEASSSFLERLSKNADFAAVLLRPAGRIVSSDRMDGVRLVLEDGAILHFRASGNAPEMRCYVEADTAERAQELLRFGLDTARTVIEENL